MRRFGDSFTPLSRIESLSQKGSRISLALKRTNVKPNIVDNPDPRPHRGISCSTSSARVVRAADKVLRGLAVVPFLRARCKQIALARSVAVYKQWLGLFCCGDHHNQDKYQLRPLLSVRVLVLSGGGYVSVFGILLYSYLCAAFVLLVPSPPAAPKTL